MYVQRVCWAWFSSCDKGIMWNSLNPFVTVNPFLILIVICCDFNSTRKYQKANLSQWLEMGWRRKISVDKRASTWNDYINIFLLNLHLTIWEHIVLWKSFARVLRHTSTRRCLIGPRSFCSITNIPKNHQKRQKEQGVQPQMLASVKP